MKKLVVNKEGCSIGTVLGLSKEVMEPLGEESVELMKSKDKLLVDALSAATTVDEVAVCFDPCSPAATLEEFRELAFKHTYSVRIAGLLAVEFSVRLLCEAELKCIARCKELVVEDRYSFQALMDIIEKKA